MAAVGATSRARARWAAGVTWTSRTANASWAFRYSHTSVVDAAGAIYVIGGHGGSNYTDLQDVWASTDGGARPDYVQGVVGGYSRGYSSGYLRVLKGAKGVRRLLEGYLGVTQG
jgi:hypothetical protein